VEGRQMEIRKKRTYESPDEFSSSERFTHVTEKRPW